MLDYSSRWFGALVINRRLCNVGVKERFGINTPKHSDILH
jgi:hypothetical protein